MSDLRKYLRSLSPELADAAKDIWRRSAPVHERQNRPSSLTENGRRHVEAVELGIWRLLRCTTRQEKANNFDLFDHAFPIFLLSAAACCHDFDKAIDTPGFVHGEGSADFIQKNQKALGLNLIQMRAIQAAIRIHDFKGHKFSEGLAELKIEEASPEGIYDLQLVAVLLKASDILHCDSSRIVNIDLIDPLTLKRLEKLKYLSRSAVKGWNPNGNKIEIQIMATKNEEFNALRQSFDYMKQQEWTAVSSVLKYKKFPYDLTMPELQKENRAPNRHNKTSSSKKTIDTSESITSACGKTVQVDITLSDNIQLLPKPFDSEEVRKDRGNKPFFDKMIPYVERTVEPCSFVTILDEFSGDRDVKILSGSQKMGKSWLAKRLIDALAKKNPDMYYCHVRVATSEVDDIIQDFEDCTERPEYIIYGLWCHKILWQISAIPDKYVSSNKYSLYKANIKPLIQDIVAARDKEENKSKSVFWIVSNIVEKTLKEAGLDNIRVVIFLEAEDMHKLVPVSARQALMDRTSEAFKAELRLLRQNPRLDTSASLNKGRIKMIVTTRQIDIKELHRPYPPDDVCISVREFSREECDAFLDESAGIIRSVLGNRFANEDAVELLKSAIYESTSGYPWFFQRWLRAFLFVAINSETSTCSDMSKYVDTHAVFWYCKDPFREEFLSMLKKCKRFAGYPSMPGDQSKFLKEILGFFGGDHGREVDMDRNEDSIKKRSDSRKEYLLRTYARRFKYVYDTPRSLQPEDNGADDIVSRPHSAMVSEDDKFHLELERIGLVYFRSRSRENRVLCARNKIIERFFDPFALSRLMGIRLL